MTGQDTKIRVIYQNEDYDINDLSDKNITDPNKIKENSDINSQKYKVEYNGETYDLDIETYS